MPRTLRARNYFHPDGFPIAVDRRVFRTGFDLHGHDFSQIVLVTGGRAMHRVGRDTWPLFAGVTFVIKDKDTHAYTEPDNLSVIYVHYRPDRLKWDVSDLTAVPGYHALFAIDPAGGARKPFNSRLHLRPAEIGHLVGLIDALDAELKARKPGFRFLAQALFMQVVVYLSRVFGREDHPDSQALLRIATVISHLETKFAEPIELDDLAERAGMSKRTFLRTFHAATGQSPIAYLIQTRINRAADLLRTTDDPVTQVAFACGFSDSNYFTRQFRQMMTVSPRDYRSSNRP